MYIVYEYEDGEYGHLLDPVAILDTEEEAVAFAKRFVGYVEAISVPHVSGTHWPVEIKYLFHYDRDGVPFYESEDRSYSTFLTGSRETEVKFDRTCKYVTIIIWSDSKEDASSQAEDLFQTLVWPEPEPIKGELVPGTLVPTLRYPNGHVEVGCS